MNYWLLLEKSDQTRISKGIDGYLDETGQYYSYDSLVPNFRNLGEGDFVVLRKESEIAGIGSIGVITKQTDNKIHRRCPKCSSTDIRSRITKQPQMKCGKCAAEFSEAVETITAVQAFKAEIRNFVQLDSPPAVKDVKMCAACTDGSSSQLSILRLDPVKIRTLFEGIDTTGSTRKSLLLVGGQGFGLSRPERRAVELWAMKVARALYEGAGWEVVDTSSSHPYDLFATKQGQTRFIEVKGSTGNGRSIILTHGEVSHIRENSRNSALVVVSGIVLGRSNGTVEASGGEVTNHSDPWILESGNLHPTQYRYELP